ncbi:MAG: 50S ribosomal protein L3 [Candidatus Omnitrophica bacterium]|nr:50S ribosomal protein L3 [Candidatus Omnitrophota bacterium]
MIGLLGRKLGMSQVFEEDGKQVPVTVVEVGPCYVTALRTKGEHGYTAVQMGFGDTKEKTLTKPVREYLKKVKSPNIRFIHEIRTEQVEGLEIGHQLKVSNFQTGDYVDVEGTSIGKGFQGVVKRHHFKGSASKSHGSMHGRVPGSIGQSSFPSRVLKGMRAAGHMGNEKVTVQNLKVLKVDEEQNLMAIKGAVPGTEGAFLIIRMALKRGDKSRKWKVPSSSQGSSGESAKAGEAKETKAEAEDQNPEETKS